MTLTAFVFLGSVRATLIRALAVPVSVIGSFAVLLLMGYTARSDASAKLGSVS